MDHCLRWDSREPDFYNSSSLEAWRLAKLYKPSLFRLMCRCVPGMESGAALVSCLYHGDLSPQRTLAGVETSWWRTEAQRATRWRPIVQLFSSDYDGTGNNNATFGQLIIRVLFFFAAVCWFFTVLQGDFFSEPKISPHLFGTIIRMATYVVARLMIASFSKSFEVKHSIIAKVFWQRHASAWKSILTLQVNDFRLPSVIWSSYVLNSRNQLRFKHSLGIN